MQDLLSVFKEINQQCDLGKLLEIALRLKERLLKCRSDMQRITVLNNFTVVALYAPPKNKILKTDLQQILNLGNKVIAAGDLNAKHLSWNCYYNNKNGNTIYNYIERNPYTLEYPSNFTLYPHNLT